MAGVPGQIIGELAELGKKIGTETAKVPRDIAGKALESLGSASGQTPQATSAAKLTSEKPATTGPWEKFDEVKDEKVKKTMARAALAQLAGKPKAAAPPVAEKLEQEERAKKEAAAKQAAAAAQMAPIAVPRGRRRGDLYGLSAKQSSEKSRNVRQD